MASLLAPRFDCFKFKLPEYFFPEELIEKYRERLKDSRILITDPIEYLNQTIISVQFLGMGNGTFTQPQQGRSDMGTVTSKVNKFGQISRIDMNRFPHNAAEQYYRTAQNPLALLDKTFKITFRHVLGFWNYFFMFEAFFYQTLRDTPSDDDTLKSKFNIEILDPVTGTTISKVVLMEPLIDQIQELDLSYQKVHPESQTFTVQFKFNNIDYQFVPWKQ